MSKHRHMAALMTVSRPYARYAAALILAVLVFRVIVLVFNHTGLHGDEAQYWAWSLEPAFGYYSKPPMIAWIIWTTTSLFGHEEWAVRLASPFLHSATAALCFLSASHLYNQRAGLIAAALYLLMPGVALSAALISTDAALLLFVALAVLAWLKLRDAPSMAWAFVLGIAIGLGMLSKYAMLFILPALGMAALFEPRTRQALLWSRGLLAAAVAGLILLPNILWNARHSFVTLVHTTDNANLRDGPQVNPLELVEFLGGQFGVFGPITFILLILALWWGLRQRDKIEFWLALMVLTPLTVISFEAFISRANANWAAAAYGVAPILLAGWINTAQRLTWLKRGVGLNLALCVIPAIVLTSEMFVNQLGFANSVKRQRAWPATVTAIQQLYQSGEFEAIAADNRLVFYDLLYYGMEDTAPLFMWRYEPRTSNHAELTQALPQDDRSVLLISYYHSYDEYFARDFDRLEYLRDIDIPLGGGKVRELKAYRASGYKGPDIRPD